MSRNVSILSVVTAVVAVLSVLSVATVALAETETTTSPTSPTTASATTANTANNAFFMLALWRTAVRGKAGQGFQHLSDLADRIVRAAISPRTATV